MIHNNVAIVCLSFFFSEVLDKFLKSLKETECTADIYILVNSSRHDQEIRLVINEYKKTLNIIQVAFFERNISSNAYQLFLEYFYENQKYEYVVVTDADFEVFDSYWLDFSINLLLSETNIFSVSHQVFSTSLSEKIPTIIKCTPTETDLENGWCVGRAGWVLKTMRYQELGDFIKFLRLNNVFFHDCEADVYARHHLKKQSVVSLKESCKHLTWDYSNPEYKREKNKFPNTWYHDMCADFTVDVGGDTCLIKPAYYSVPRTVQKWRRVTVINNSRCAICATVLRNRDRFEICRKILHPKKSVTFAIVQPGYLHVLALIANKSITLGLVDDSTYDIEFECSDD